MTDEEKITLANKILAVKVESTPSGPGLMFDGRRYYYAYQLAAAMLNVEPAVLLGRK